MNYLDFIKSKHVKNHSVGIDVPESQLHPQLFPWQRRVTRWALKQGRVALWEGCGLGKTIQQLEWARHICNHTGKPGIIYAPLAVANQTAREAANRLGMNVTVCRNSDDVRDGVNITNYEMHKHFDPSVFGCVVLDESSILKSFMGKTKRELVDAYSNTPYRLCATATPAPNDLLEIGNHAQFLGIMDSNEMISRWFINDTMEAGKYILKGHAEKDFWDWIATWAVCINKPSDIGFDDDGYELKDCDYYFHTVDADVVTDASPDLLFRDGGLSATNVHKEGRITIVERAKKAAEIVASDKNTPWILWCYTNYEADELKKNIPEAVEIRGSDKPSDKERKLIDFTEGRIRILITKPEIAGFGLNWQHCHNNVFVGLSYSFEQVYQAIRRTYRFGQTETVNVHIISAVSEGSIVRAVKGKELEYEKMQRAMNESMRRNSDLCSAPARKLKQEVDVKSESAELFTMWNDDCIDRTSKMETDSIDYCVFSPPFSNLYIYSDSERDMGNSYDDDEFFGHFTYLAKELYRVMVPGRLVSFHCKDLPLYKGRDGSAGLKDFPGRCIDMFERAGFTFHSRCTIWKDPVIEMQRTKNHGLLHKQLCKDSSASRQGMADYLITMRKWVDGLDSFPRPVTGVSKDARFDTYEGEDKPTMRDDDVRGYSIQVWQRYASPVWMDIDQTDVLNYELAREDRDEKHICPLQLGVIRRCVHLWTNPNDLVYSPFGGIGSEGYVSVKMGRRFVGCELKEAYWKHAVKNLRRAESEVAEERMELFA